MNDLLTLTGATLVVFSAVPYVIDIVRGKTRPNVVSWFTWALIITIGAFAALSAHQTRTAIITFGDAAQVVIILLLGLKFGYAKFSLFDGICQVSAIAGLILWFIFNDPLLAIVVGIVVDLIAALPTYRHSWLQPNEETWQSYAISSLGAAVGLASLTSFTATSLAYPSYLFILGLSISATIVIRRKMKGVALFR
jgi:hypothetical protein